ncbi:unnamed protein product [Arabis nemorensis]|uniref:Uncharacterized protein n=1 Tax=Arabis nemorensis TaxID=586526 RepID=A0A565AN98_9BRAS|nr:unnamed protein product [Arabis nemorensis]
MSGLLVDLVHCSSIHGFIGLSHPGRRFTVCNPSTRQVITLPDMEASSGRKEGVYMYLGYDPVGNEYKALCSTGFYGKRHQEHKVLTLGKRGNLSWRDISGRRTPCYMVVTNGICINGKVYYIGMTLGVEKKKLVFRFDVKGERMRYIRPPLPVKALGSLINFKGKLGVAYHLSYDPLRRFDIVVLDDLEKGMWSCQRIVFNPLMLELSGKIQLKILGVNKMGEIIFGPLKLPRKHEPLYIFLYNIKMSGDRFIRRIKLEGFEEFGCNHTGEEHCDTNWQMFNPEEEWVKTPRCEYLGDDGCVDLAYKDKRLYILADCGRIRILDFSPDYPIEVTNHPYVYGLFMSGSYYFWTRMKLTTSGHVLMIQRVRDRCCLKFWFQVYKMNSSNGEWERLDSLKEEEALVWDLSVTLPTKGVSGIKKDSYIFL